MPALIDYSWRDLNLKLYISKRRKSIGFKASNQGLVIYVPEGVSTESLNKVLEVHYQWLQDKYTFVSLPLRSLKETSIWPVWGQDKYLHWQVANPKDMPSAEMPTGLVKEDRLVLFLPSNKTDHKHQLQALKQFYHQQTLTYAQQRLDYWYQCMQLGVIKKIPKWVKSLTIKHYRSRWGSCNYQGDIQLNCLLAMAPKAVMDYVLVHELCHLKYMQHSQQFWQLVAYYEPTYKTHVKWLRTQGAQLNFEVEIE